MKRKSIAGAVNLERRVGLLWRHMGREQAQKRPFSFIKQWSKADTQIKRDVASLTRITVKEDPP